VLQALEAEAQVAQQPEAQALEQQEKAEPLALPRRR
jgi:hypothetical protein